MAISGFSGLQRNNSLRGTPPTSQKMKTGQQKEGLVTLSLSGGGNTQGGSSSPDTFTFPIRPEQFALDMPARQTVTQTINGAYQDHWGNGVGQIQLSGHTGWRKKGDAQDDGYHAFMKLRDMHDRYCQLCGDTKPEDVHLELVVAVPNGFGHYRISSDRFRTLKNTQSPLLYRYEMQCTVLKDMTSSAGESSSAQSSVFNNNVTTTGRISDSLAVFSQSTSELMMVSNSLLPQQTYQYVVREGETTEGIAHMLLGNSQYSTLIEKYNPQTRGGKLIAGTVINIPILGAIV